MRDLLFLVLSIGIIAITVSIIVLVRGVLRELKKVGRASEDLSALLTTVNTEIVPVTQNATSTLGDIDELVVTLTDTVTRVDSVASGVERLLDTAHVASAATKAVKSSSVGLVSVYEGVKQGIRSFRGD